MLVMCLGGDVGHVFRGEACNVFRGQRLVM